MPILLSEVVTTAGLLLLIATLARTGRTQHAAWSVGAWIGAAYWFTASTAFANPPSPSAGPSPAATPGSPRPPPRPSSPPRSSAAPSHGKAAEYQARGAVHFHALLRLDGYDEHHPDRLLPPPPGITVADLEDATRHAAATIVYLTPTHDTQPSGWLVAWGDELDVRIITLRGTGTVTDLMVASYLAKYSTKGTEVTGHTSTRITPDTADLYANPAGSHTERLIHAAWTLGRHEDYTSLRRWAHMLGFGGHFFTKSGHYSLTFADLRNARITYRRAQDTGPEHDPIRTADHADEETTLIVGTLSYAGTGWRTTGDALLANTAADQARKRREAGHEELAHEYNSTTTGRQAA